jgi:uncharacterized protein YcbK (DUF882 family)
VAKYLSPHITKDEFSCPCCGQLPPDLYRDGEMLTCYSCLFDAFESIRLAWGKPIKITSGYRCPKHNLEVGGEPLSSHLYGLALDLHVEKNDVSAFVEIARGTDLRIGWKKYTDPLVHIDAAFFIWPRPSASFVRGCEW